MPLDPIHRSFLKFLSFFWYIRHRGKKGFLSWFDIVFVISLGSSVTLSVYAFFQTLDPSQRKKGLRSRQGSELNYEYLCFWGFIIFCTLSPWCLFKLFGLRIYFNSYVIQFGYFIVSSLDLALFDIINYCHFRYKKVKWLNHS